MGGEIRDEIRVCAVVRMGKVSNCLNQVYFCNRMNEGEIYSHGKGPEELF